MQYRKLGKTGLNVSLVSLGSGGPSKLGQNTGLSGDDQDSLVRSCLELGINLIDIKNIKGNDPWKRTKLYTPRFIYYGD